MNTLRSLGLACLLMAAACPAAMAASAPAAEIGADRLTAMKADAVRGVDARTKLAQEMNDSLFSFGELGFQEVETSRYITGILEKNGFKIVRGVAGLPTGWVATWTNGTGGPVIAMGSDLDGIPKASQMPGVAKRQPIVEGAPGHGEGHNSGQALNTVAALAVKDVMMRENIPGTIMLWPGVAEEMLSGKAFFVKAGVFKDVDAVLFTHVSADFGTSWGQPSGTGLVSVQYTFHGESAHSAISPWLGKSALDAVELMDIGWNYRREHLLPEQRSHRVITDGGDQPNVVPPLATVWYFFREQTFDLIKKNFEIGNTMAAAAAMMTDTTVTRQIIGSAAPEHFNRPMAEAAYANIKAVGLPTWTPQEQAFAKDVQKMMGVREQGLSVQLRDLRTPPARPDSGASDDIGDVSWTVPTITITYPANIPGMTLHHWSSAIAMATPIAHKGVVAGAKVMAMTTLDLLTKPELRAAAKAYFKDVQNKDQHYVPMLAAADKPQIQMNADKMALYRDKMRAFYYDPKKYPTYLEQLGVPWPPAPKAN